MRRPRRQDREASRYRVLAHVRDESELRVAKDILDESTSSGSLILGVADELGVDSLRELVSSVRILGEVGPSAESQQQLGTLVADPPTGLLRLRFDTTAAHALPALQEVVEAEPIDVYLVQFTGPLFSAWRLQLTELNVQLLRRVAGYLFTARIERETVGQVVDLPFVLGLRLYGPEDTLHFMHLLAVREDDEGLVSYDCILHRSDDVPVVERRMDQLEIRFEFANGRKIRFSAERGDRVLVELARMPEVAAIDEHFRPTPSNDHARYLIGLGMAPVPPARTIPQTGTGEIVAVADTGLDTSHRDLQACLLGYADRTGIGRFDPDGHGTHVCASVAGDGTCSAGLLQGVAPRARVYFQGLMDAAGQMSGEDPGFDDVLEQAYEAGARIHSDSWSVAENASRYAPICIEVDHFVREHPDMLVVVSAGNSGTGFQPQHVAAGFVDHYSMDAPGTAKNVLTVGASCGDRRNLENPEQTWGSWDAARFPNPPVSRQLVTGDSETLAAFSSRGPGERATARIKPDLVAPGTYVLSARAATGARESWLDDPARADYVYWGGSSMAAPFVAGAAALVREYLATARAHDPSASLVKAILINGARWLTGDDAMASNAHPPNVDQGFGLLSIHTSIPTPEDSELSLEFVDEWTETGLQDVGDSRTYCFDVTGEREVRICLAWDDVAGSGLQNALGLMLLTPDGQRVYGNADRRDASIDPDPHNNVQIVRIAEPVPGRYEVQVWFDNMLEPLQRFALVVTGGVAGLQRVLTLTTEVKQN